MNYKIDIKNHFIINGKNEISKHEEFTKIISKGTIDRSKKFFYMLKLIKEKMVI